MIWIVGLFALGLSLSAFFSGSETGFYRVTRVRLVIDGLGGDLTARGLLRLTNNPALFVATTLVGNNLANYLTSLAIVLGVERAIGSHFVAELTATICITPLIFVYGELLPKNLFFHAPNRLLRAGGPFFLFCTLLFSPVSALLWLLGRLLELLVGEPPLRVQLQLARKELQQVLQEGHDAGILKPAQRTLAQNLFTLAPKPVGNFAQPIGRIPSVKLGTRKADVVRIARRQKLRALPVTESSSRKIMGYLRIVDLHLDDGTEVMTDRTLMEIDRRESHIAALIRMQSEKAEMALVRDEYGHNIGLLYADDLIEPLFRD